MKDMSREIKFRAWDKKGKRMVNDLGFALVYEKLKRAIGMFNWDDIVPMQYTGLKDKNGKEIYEGDVVKGDDFQRFSGNPVVKWGDSGSFILEIDTGKSAYRETFFSFLQGGGHEFRHLEVIGNIYEHPHLLESGIIRNNQ